MTRDQKHRLRARLRRERHEDFITFEIVDFALGLIADFFPLPRLYGATKPLVAGKIECHFPEIKGWKP